MAITGGCLCRAVRYEVDAAPVTVRTCWCRTCQYVSGGSAAVNVVFPSDKIRIMGATREYEIVADSGTRMSRAFCPACGSPMFTRADTRPHLISVRAGTLDDPEIGRPQLTIWTSEAPSWACINPDIPSDERQPSAAVLAGKS
jgi:hypothetical protein